MTAKYTFDVYSTLDGFGSYGEEGDWGGYWGKEGPQFLEHRLHLYQQPQRMVLGANTFREMSSMIGPRNGAFQDLDPVNTALRASSLQPHSAACRTQLLSAEPSD